MKRAVALVVALLWIVVTYRHARAWWRMEDGLRPPESQAATLYEQAAVNRSRDIREGIAPYYRLPELLADSCLYVPWTMSAPAYLLERVGGGCVRRSWYVPELTWEQAWPRIAASPYRLLLGSMSFHLRLEPGVKHYAYTRVWGGGPVLVYPMDPNFIPK